jgi:hypothetical protein
MTEPDQPHGDRPPAGDSGQTGNARVDAALVELDRIAALPPADQVSGYAAVQAELQATLAALDEER